MKSSTLTKTVSLIILAAAGSAFAASENTAGPVNDDVIGAQRDMLAKATDGAGFGPQSPRDVDAAAGANARVFEAAPAYTEMNLCNIHFHEGAEHKGGQFTTYAGNGDGKGFSSGFLYDGDLTAAELAPVDFPVGESEHGDLQPGDTIEIHYVHTTAKVDPGPTLGSCLNEAIANPQLRVEAQVYVLVNDEMAADFMHLTTVGKVGEFNQVVNFAAGASDPIQYAGSTTGPGYNEKGSPFQVTWSVHPEVTKVNIATVANWLAGNEFDEGHAHGVRNLVMNPNLLSPM